MEEFQRHTVAWANQMEDSFKQNTGILSKLDRLDDLQEGFQKMLVNQEKLLKGIQNMDTHFVSGQRAMIEAVSRNIKPIWPDFNRIWKQLVVALAKLFKSGKK